MAVSKKRKDKSTKKPVKHSVLTCVRTNKEDVEREKEELRFNVIYQGSKDVCFLKLTAGHCRNERTLISDLYIVFEDFLNDNKVFDTFREFADKFMKYMEKECCDTEGRYGWLEDIELRYLDYIAISEKDSKIYNELIEEYEECEVVYKLNGKKRSVI